MDGFNSAASLYDMSGSLIESVGDAPEECAIKNVGNNGISEFTLNDKPFCAYVISNTATTPAQAWNIIEMGEGPTFAGATYYWTFPQGGMGDISNPVRTALPRIAKVADTAVFMRETNRRNGAVALARRKVPYTFIARVRCLGFCQVHAAAQNISRCVDIVGCVTDALIGRRRVDCVFVLSNCVLK